MKIGIDVRTLETGHKYRGIGIYTENLISSISEIDDINNYFFYTQTKPSVASRLIKNTNFHFKDILIRETSQPELYNWYKDQIFFPKAVRESKADLIHILDQLSCPFLKVTKTVVTVHDLIQISKFSKANIKNRIKIYPVRKADKIIAISKAVKDDLINTLKIPAAKIKVIYNGYNQKIFVPATNQKKIDNFRKKILKKDGKYLLYIGSFGEYEPRKNVDFLIDVFEKFLNRNKNSKIFLLLIGKEGWESKRIKNNIKNKKISQNVIFAGHIIHENLPIYFQAAEVFLFPSLVEGFGLPPLEAMASGCPVISSNTTSLSEVVGKGGILIDPYNTELWVNSIEKILSNKNFKKVLVEKGLIQAKKFSWKKCAREVLDVYKEVCNAKS